VTARQKRYSYADPLLRVWVRLHCRPVAPTDEELAREVHRYALPRLPQQPEAALVMATAGSAMPDDELSREIHRYARPRLPHREEPALALANAGPSQAPADGERKGGWGIIEID
jgi:hypothetical protein